MAVLLIHSIMCGDLCNCDCLHCLHSQSTCHTLFEGNSGSGPGSSSWATYDFVKFSPKNCMKLRNFFSVGEAPPNSQICQRNLVGISM